MKQVREKLFEVEVAWDADRAIPAVPHASILSKRPGREILLLTRSQLDALELLQDQHPSLRIRIHDLPVVVVTQAHEH